MSLMTSLGKEQPIIGGGGGWIQQIYQQLQFFVTKKSILAIMLVVAVPFVLASFLVETMGMLPNNSAFGGISNQAAVAPQPPDRSSVKIIYSHHPADRSGLAIFDMMLADSHAQNLGYDYGGACSPPKPPGSRVATEGLLKHLGWLDRWNRCPTDRPLEEYEFVRGYRGRGAPPELDLLSTNYLAKLKNITYQQPWFQGASSSNTYKITVHIRRGDVMPCTWPWDRYNTNAYYSALIDMYKNTTNKDVKVTIFSECSSFESLQPFQDDDGYTVKVGTPITDVVSAMIDSDVFIMSASGFSYMPALVARGTVVYTHFYLQALPHFRRVINGSLGLESREQVKLWRNSSRCVNATQGKFPSLEGRTRCGS